MSEPRRPRWLGIGFLSFALLGSLLSFALAGFQALAFASPQSAADPSYSSMVAWGVLACCTMGFIGIRAAILAGGVLAGAAAPRSRPSTHWLWVFLLVPIGISLNAAFSGEIPFTNPSYVVCNLTAASLAVLAIVLMLRWVGPPISARRAWGQFLLGLWGAVPIAVVIEVLVPIFAIILLQLVPSIFSRLEAFYQQFRYQLMTPPLDSEALLRQLVREPWLLVLSFGFAVVVIPIIEETAKTIAIWPFLRRRLSAEDAFLGGALAGAGFALFEMYFLTEPAQRWPITLVGRMLTSLMHCTASGLASWALAEGIVRRNWRRLIKGYIGAVLLHGVWNASVLLQAASVLLPFAEPGSPLSFVPRGLPELSGIIMVGLAAGTTIALPWALVKLREANGALVDS
ncbi:MAG: PrsW family glutamic-type intramembrane protease [Anaerolineales bacterium]